MLPRLTLVVVAALVAPLTVHVSASPAAAAPTLPTKRLHRSVPKPADRHAADPHRVLVRFRTGVDTAGRRSTAARRGGRLGAAVAGTRFVAVRGDDAAGALAERLRKDPNVAEVLPDRRRRPSFTPNDPGYVNRAQDYLKTVRLPQAWDRIRSATGQIIAVVDTGVDASHPDLAGRVVAGYNAVTPGAATNDLDPATEAGGHGTMVAGVAAANTHNAQGVAGAAFAGRVMPIKVFQPDGTAFDSDIAEGVTWAADHGAKIINLSLGGPGAAPVLLDAIRYANSHGALVVGAAGNAGSAERLYPAAYPEVLSVGATDTAGRLADFSSYDASVDLAAPGVEIASTFPGNRYAIADGTSFSAPLVSGIAALTWTKYPHLTPAEVADRLTATARDAGPRGQDPFYGAGVVDAAQAVGDVAAPAFPIAAMGADEPNDVPARATGLDDTATGTLAESGDIDWYTRRSATTERLRFTLTPAALTAGSVHHLDPELVVLNEDHRPIARVNQSGLGAAESVVVTVPAGLTRILVMNVNGSGDTRPYTLTAERVTEPGEGPPFGPAHTVGTGSNPVTTAVGDVTGDGHADVLLATNFSFGSANDYKLFVFAGRADGTLAEPVTYPVATVDGAPLLAVLDTDDDDRLDVVVGGAGLQVFRQNAGGTLDAATAVAGAPAEITGLVAARMDADARTDLVVAGPAGTTLLTRTPTGFAAAPVSAEAATALAVGDLDADGRPDVAGFADGGVRVFRHNAGGWTSGHHAVPRMEPSNDVAVGDVTGDGRADVVATSGGNFDGTVWVLRQDTAGALGAPAAHHVTDSPESVAVADMDGDGRGDIVAVHGGFATISLLRQYADGTLAPPETAHIPVGYGYHDQSLTLADVTGDGRPDAVATDGSNGLVVAPNALVTPSDPPRLTTPIGPQALLADLTPAPWEASVATSEPVTVRFAGAVQPASVNGDTVRLFDGYTDTAVPATVSYDDSTRTATLTPTGGLREGTPYQTIVAGVRDAAGTALGGELNWFSTANAAPPAVTGLTVATAPASARLSWTAPTATDLSQVIVRYAAGTVAPATPAAGTLGYADSGTTTLLSLPGASYAANIWVRDRSGALSPPTRRVFSGTRTTAAASTTSVRYGGTVTLSGAVVRQSGGTPRVGVPVTIERLVAGTTTWSTLTTRVTNSAGRFSYALRPAATATYRMTYAGSGAWIGSRSQVAVAVSFAVSAKMSRTSMRLGGTAVLSGLVSPRSGGAAVRLERLVGRTWKPAGTARLSATSAFSFRIRPTRRGTYTYRVVKPADTAHRVGVTSARSVKVT